MKKAAEKSAVRWSCAVLAVLFFFCCDCALTLHGMQRRFGCAADDAAGQEALISGMYNDSVTELKEVVRPYFEFGRTEKLVCPSQYQPENTNLLFDVKDSANHIVLQNYDEKAEFGDLNGIYPEIKTDSLKFYSMAEGSMEQTENLTIEMKLRDTLEVDDVYRRAMSLIQIGGAMETAFRIFSMVFLALTLLFCVPALRSVLREAKRPKGAARLFNVLPPDLYLACVLPALVLFGRLLLDPDREREMLKSYLHSGAGEYRFFLRPACMTGVFALLLVFLMLLVFSLRVSGFRGIVAVSRYGRTPFPHRILFYLLAMQGVKILAITLYLTTYTRWVVLFLLLEKLVTLPVVFRLLRQMRDLMDRTAQLVQGDLSVRTSRESDYATMRAHGADVDSIARRISDSADEYVKSSSFKAELITNLSHDIKTPLTSIISYAQLLDRDDLSQEERRDYLDVLQRHSERLQKLVDDLTEVSDAASGNVPVQTTVLDLCSLISASAAAFEERLRNQRITIRFRMPEEPVFVTADPRLLQRVTDNLMNNICKYTLPGSEVQIAVVDGDSSIAAVFRNRSASPFTMTGDALMARFVREDGARHTDGSGLGLSIAQSLMHLQGGRLWLHTEGDVFTAQILFRKS